MNIKNTLKLSLLALSLSSSVAFANGGVIDIAVATVVANLGSSIAPATPGAAAPVGFAVIFGAQGGGATIGTGGSNAGGTSNNDRK